VYYLLPTADKCLLTYSAKIKEWMRHLPAPSKSGTDFGRPRFGVNTFEFAWLLLHPQEAFVTTLAPGGKGGSKPETTCN
jgi:hypothetical protein